MGVMKACYSLDILHKGFNVPNFILDKDNGESDGKAVLSRPLKSVNMVDVIEILTGLQNPVLPGSPHPLKELIQSLVNQGSSCPWPPARPQALITNHQSKPSPAQAMHKPISHNVLCF